MKYYRLDNILKYDTPYYFIIGQRSNGKTYSVLEYVIKNYLEKGERACYVRRWGDDFKRNQGKLLFANHGDIVKNLSGGQFVGVKYWQMGWYMVSEKKIKHKNGEIEYVQKKEDKPFCYGYALNSMEHDKGSTPENITTIIYDEAVSRIRYLPNEASLFFNVVSTLVRNDGRAKIFMLGNTVSKYCPYFSVLGIKFIPEMKQGDIRQNEDKSVTVERTEDTGARESDKYFRFEDKTVSMITGGKWEIADYPHINIKWKKENILFNIFIDFDGQKLHGEIVNVKGSLFIFFYPKYDDIKNPDKDYIFSDKPDYRQNWYSSITRPRDEMTRLINTIFTQGKVFYSDNDTGEIIKNFIAENVVSTQARYRNM